MISPSPYSIALAHEAAVGHFNAGVELYRAFAEPKPETAGDPYETFGRAVRHGVPAITNFALGLELLLKVHHFQIDGIYPRGHDIAELGSKFEDVHLEVLRKNYSRLYGDKAIDKGLEFRISTAPPGSAWTQADTSTYDLAIAYIGNAYAQWRYIYEKFQEEMNISFAFAPLYFASASVNKAIVEFKGNTRITIAQPPPNTSFERTREE